MKKKIALLLAVVLVVATFGMVLAACDKGPSADALQALLTEVNKYHRSDPTLTNSNFNLIGRISTITDEGEVEVNVSWKSSSDKITISSEMNGAGFYTVTIPDRTTLTEDIDYTLTATLVDAKGKEYKDADGKTYSITFSRTVTASGAAQATLTFDSITKATTGEANTDQYGYAGFLSITWQENDVTFLNEKDESYSACTTSYINPARIYAFSKVEISYVKPIKYIKLETQSGNEQGLDGVTVEGGTVQRAETTIIITMDQPAEKVTFIPKKQLRIYTVDVYTAEATPPVLPTIDDTVYETEDEIIAALKQLESGKTLSNGHTYTLTGTIASIDTKYNSQFGNITVTINVGSENYPIQCFRLVGGEDLAVGDTITVTGVLKNYDGKIEFDAKCTYVKGGGSDVGGGDDDTTLTSPVTIKSNQTTTTNLTGTNDKDKFDFTSGKGLFTIVGTKVSGGNNVGMNKDGTVRLYKNGTTTLTISIAQGYVIDSVTIKYKTGNTYGDTIAPPVIMVGEDTVNATGDATTIEEYISSLTWNINGQSFVITNTDTANQVHIVEIIVTCHQAA